MRPSFFRSISVTHTPVQPALPVCPDMQAYRWCGVRKRVQTAKVCNQLLRLTTGMRLSFLQSTSVTHTPVQPALPVRPELQAGHLRWGTSHADMTLG